MQEADDGGSSCTVNREFLLSLATTVGKTGSALGRVDTSASKAAVVCASYDASTAKGQAACEKDRANLCWLVPVRWLRGGTQSAVAVRVYVRFWGLNPPCSVPITRPYDPSCNA